MTNRVRTDSLRLLRATAASHQSRRQVGVAVLWELVVISLSGYRFLMPIDFQKFIERNPQVCGGEPVVRGTRVTIRTILASLAEGASVEEIVANFPTVSPEAVRAMIAYAAASAEEDLPTPPLPILA